ncbi:MAG: TetR/AcrR family transcriptional regulator [Acidimicrobiales bacterium]
MADDPIVNDLLGDRLVSAAAEVFAESGYQGARVAEIARRAGVTTGAIYSRYRGKAELLVHALGEPLGDQIDRLSAESPDGSTRLLASLADDIVEDHGFGDRLLIEAILSARRDPGIAEVVDHRFTDGELRLAKVIQQAKDSGLVDADLPTEGLAQLAMAIGLGMQLRRVAGAPKPDVEDWHAVIDMMFRAAAPQTEPLEWTRGPE